ncbi:MAG: hydantoinase/oxoprolinase family protein, partial [bacterium]|nr:hydantoinase/oxoprolinase family protein [bacterium]
REATEAQRSRAAAEALLCDAAEVRRAAQTACFSLYVNARREAVAVDRSGVVRLRRRDAFAHAFPAAAVAAQLERAFERWTTYGDVGRALPRCALFVGARIADVGDVSSLAQALALAREELRSMPHDEPIGIVLSRQRA